MEREDITRSTSHFIASPSKQVFQTGKVSGRNFDVGGNRLGKGRMGIINWSSSYSGPVSYSQLPLITITIDSFNLMLNLLFKIPAKSEVPTRLWISHTGGGGGGILPYIGCTGPLRCQINGGGSKWTGVCEISEKFNEWGVKINGEGWEFSEKFNLTKQGSHDTAARACCGVRFWREMLRQKCTRACVKWLPSIDLFCFGLLFSIGIEKIINGRALLSSGDGGGKNIEKLISGGGDVYLAPKSMFLWKGYGFKLFTLEQGLVIKENWSRTGSRLTGLLSGQKLY